MHLLDNMLCFSTNHASMADTKQEGGSMKVCNNERRYERYEKSGDFPVYINWVYKFVNRITLCTQGPSSTKILQKPLHTPHSL